MLGNSIRWLTRAATVAVLLAAAGTLTSAAPASNHRAGRAAPAGPLTAARAAPPTPPACSAFQVPGQIQQLGCAYVVGYSNVTKLDGAALLGSPDPALIAVESAALDKALAAFKTALAGHRSFARETDPPLV